MKIVGYGEDDIKFVIDMITSIDECLQEMDDKNQAGKISKDTLGKQIKMMNFFMANIKEVLIKNPGNSDLDAEDDRWN